MGRSLRYYYRFYDKKRGDRRTASSTWGNIWLSLFFGAFLLGGLGLSLGIFATMTLPELRVNRDYLEATCRVLSKRVDQEVDNQAFRPQIEIEFQLAGDTHTVMTTYDIAGRYNGDRQHSQNIIDAFQIGTEYPCWYDPRDPDRAVLVRGYSWYATLMMLFPVPFLAIGGGGLIYLITNWGKSTERRALQSQQAAQRDPFQDTDGRQVQYPSVPTSSYVTNSPGTTLAYRLPVTTPTWSLLALLTICVLFNGIVGIFLTMFVRGLLHGTPEWSLVLFIGPFGAAGAALVYFFVRQAILVTGIGVTLVEISDHPLYPGGKYEVFISQTGRLKMKTFRVLLVCDEEATYHQGTNTRTAQQRVREQELFRRDNFEIQPGAPFETQVALEVSEGAMHSFTSANNQIGWKIFVRGEVEGKPDYERAFLVTVYPAGAREHEARGQKAMSNETIEITLDEDQRHYLPGDTLSGEYALHLPLAADPKAVEVSVLWYTEGKGDEDLAVHYFERNATGNGETIDFRQPRRFSTDLPNSPLSYEGVIVKLRWCVRVRLFLTRGKEVVAEEPFQLGQVPGVQLVTESVETTESGQAEEV